MLYKLLFSAAIANIVLACSYTISTSQPPSDWRLLTAAYVTRLPTPELYHGALISKLKKSEGPQPGDWFACLKLSNQSFYAIFFRGEEVVGFRQPVIIDNCYAADQPLPEAPIEKPKD